MLFSNTRAVITSLSVCTATNRSLGGAVDRKSLKFSVGQEAQNDTFSNLSLQAKEQRRSNFQYLPYLQQQVVW